MQRFALVTGADRGLGVALTAGLPTHGWHLLASQYRPDWPELAERYLEQLTILPLDVALDDSV